MTPAPSTFAWYCRSDQTHSPARDTTLSSHWRAHNVFMSTTYHCGFEYKISIALPNQIALCRVKNKPGCACLLMMKIEVELLNHWAKSCSEDVRNLNGKIFLASNSHIMLTHWPLPCELHVGAGRTKHNKRDHAMCFSDFLMISEKIAATVSKENQSPLSYI